MKKWTSFSPSLFCLAMGCYCIVSGGGTSLRAQQPPTTSQKTTSQPTSTLVAVVDIPRVFETHPTFKASMEAMQRELISANKKLKTKQDGLNARSQELTKLRPSSPSYRRMEAALAQQVADLQVQARQAKKEFMRREAQQYYATYQEIVDAVQRVAEQYDIDLVLRFNSSAIDPDTPQSVSQGMSRAVVVQRNLDITPLVTQQLQVALAHNNNPVR